MRTGNLLVVVLGVAALGLATVIAWRGRRLPPVAPRTLPSTAGASALDALRTLAGIVGAAAIAGVLVAGLGGRLLMRLLAATSGAGAQGKLTEADEVVGDITFDGTLGFVIFIGIALPVAAGFLYLVLRRFVPTAAILAGIVFGVLLLGTFGIDDPMASDNVDFDILSPLWLAVVSITALALLFGVTFMALAARFDAGLPSLGTGWRAVPAHAGLLLCVLPPFAFIATPYVVLRAILHGRARPLVDGQPVRTAGRVLVGLGAAAAGVASVATAVEIL
jgi:hypothetical protein